MSDFNKCSGGGGGNTSSSKDIRLFVLASVSDGGDGKSLNASESADVSESSCLFVGHGAGGNGGDKLLCALVTLVSTFSVLEFSPKDFLLGGHFGGFGFVGSLLVSLSRELACDPIKGTVDCLGSGLGGGGGAFRMA